MKIQNRVVWKIIHKFIFISFISSIAIFINPQESSALTFKRVLNRVGHHLIDELLSDEPSSQDREYDRENINQQTTDNYNTYPTNDQTYNSGNSTLGTSPISTPHYQNSAPKYQHPVPSYHYPASTSSPNFFPYPRLQKPYSAPLVIINNF